MSTIPDTSRSSHEADNDSAEGIVSPSDQSTESLHQAGQLLVYLTTQSGRGNRELFSHEADLLQKSFTTGEGTKIFKSYHVQAVRVALQNNNFGLVKMLLAKDTSYELLKDETDVLQIAMSRVGLHGWGQRYADLTKLIHLFVVHGAVISSLDEQGNSALYYACLFGNHDTFNFLIQLGGDVFTLHGRVPNGDVGQDPDALAHQDTSKINLLQIALDSRLNYERWGMADSMWYKPVDTIWGSIIIFLLDAGLEYFSSDPALVKVLHAACFDGNMTYVVKLLDLGVDINTRAGQGDSRDYTMGSALHAATLGGKKDVVDLLLNKGADPKAKRNTGRPRQLCYQTAISAAAERKNPMSSAWLQILDACETLLEAGVSNADREILLEACIKTGALGMAKRLLQRGIRIQQTPVCMHLGMVRSLVEHGCQIDFAESQKQAAGNGSMELMRYLVETSGPQIPPEAISETLEVVLKRNNRAMFQYVLSAYKISVDQTFPRQHHVNEKNRFSLLSIACIRKDFQAARFLLGEGASFDCPELSDTALGYIRQALRGRTSLAMDDVNFVRLLLQYSQGSYIRSGNLDTSLPLDNTTEDKKLNLKKMAGPVDFKGPVLNAKYVVRLVPPALQAYQESHRALSNTFKYEPLNGLQAIRLLILEPCESIDDPIRCYIHHSELFQSPEFEALSYVWGDPTDTERILLQDQEAVVTINLWCALRRLRLSDGPRLLWIDVLCINQGDTEEKNKQVRMMREIYRTAQQVVVWLGENADDSQIIFQYVRDWKPGQNTHRSSCNEIEKPSYKGQVQEAFKKLCYRPWFYRTWTIQEFALAKNVVAMCGAYTEKWSCLTEPMSFGLGLGYHPLRGIDGNTRWKQLNDMVKTGWDPSFSQYGIFSDATDPRDKVYGLLGLLAEQIIPIDYSIDVTEVYRKFTQAIIEKTGELRTLHYFGTTRLISGLQSWVPDYSVSRPVGLLPRAHESWSMYMDFPIKILPGLEFRDTDLVIKGRFLDTVSTIGDELVADAGSYTGSEEFGKVFHGWECLASTLISTKQFSATVTEAFLETITVYTDNIKRNTIKSLDWYNVYGTGVLEKTDSLPFLDLKDIHDLEEWAGISKRRSVESSISYFTTQVEMGCYGRSFFVTEGGTMGMASPRARAGDHIVYFPGGLYPFVLRSCDNGGFILVGDCFLYNLDECSLFREGTAPAETYVLH